MKLQNQVCILLTVSLFALVASVKAGTIPAGTALVVKTTGSIYTKDIVGKQFTAVLDQDLVVHRSVVAPAGTKFIGKVVTSTKFGNSPLTLDLINVKAAGGSVPVKTTGVFQPQSVERGRRSRVTTRDFVLTPGTTLQFHLAQAVTI